MLFSRQFLVFYMGNHILQMEVQLRSRFAIPQLVYSIQIWVSIRFVIKWKKGISLLIYTQIHHSSISVHLCKTWNTNKNIKNQCFYFAEWSHSNPMMITSKIKDFNTWSRKPLTTSCFWCPSQYTIWINQVRQINVRATKKISIWARLFGT